MVITSLDDLQVYQLAVRAADAVSAMLRRPTLIRDRELWSQIADSSGAVSAKIAEGFGQGTDRHCAHYQRIARGSANEVCAHLSTAHGRGHITLEEQRELTSQYSSIGRMLTQWIKHLVQEDRKSRT